MKPFKKIGCGLVLLTLLLAAACGKKEEAEEQPQKLEPVAQTDTSEVQAQPDTAEQVASQPRPRVQITRTEEGKYTIQVSSWRTRAAAERDAQRFRNAGFDVYIQKAYLADRNETWYRVRIGRFATKDEGRYLVDQLTELLEAGYWLDRYRAEK